jgi:tetratricopeptide (TPR) repeat protein
VHSVEFRSRARILLPLFLGSILGILPISASAQRDMGAGYCSKHGNYTGASCPKCAAEGSSGNNTTPYQGPNIWNMLREHKEKAKQQKLKEAWSANHQGVEFAKNEDWPNAIASYQASLQKNPDDDIVRKNLAQAKARFANYRGQNAYNKGDWAAAIGFFKDALAVNPYPDNVSVYQDDLDLAQAGLQDEQAKQANKAAVASMQQAISNFAKDLKFAPVASGGGDGAGRNAGSPAAGGLDFISSTPPPAAAKSTNLEFGDPMVVDPRSQPTEGPKDMLRDAVADTPKVKVAAVPGGAIDLGVLENDLRKRLAEATDLRLQARLLAQLGWTLNQKGDTAAAVQAINEASRLDPTSPMLKLLLIAATADTREKYADAVVAAQALLKADPGNRVAAGILAEADGKLRKLTGAAAGDPIMQLVPFGQQDKAPMTGLGGSPEADKVKAEKEFAFQDFGKQSHQAQWQEPPILDRRINLELHPELQQSLAQRDALVAQSRSAAPEKAAEIKLQVQNLDKETAKQAREILKKDFPEATGL